MKIHQHGLHQYWKKNFVKRAPDACVVSSNAGSNQIRKRHADAERRQVRSFRLVDVQSAFALLGFGLLIGTVAFAIELARSKRRLLGLVVDDLNAVARTAEGLSS